MKYPEVRNFIQGKFIDGLDRDKLAVISPIDGVLLSTVLMSKSSDLDTAVSSSMEAFKTWGKTPIKERVQVFFRFKGLLEKNKKELAQLI